MPLSKWQPINGTPSFPRQCFIQIQNRQTDRRQGGMLRQIQRFIAFGRPDTQESLAHSSGRPCRSPPVVHTPAAEFSDRSRLGLRLTTRRNAWVSRSSTTGLVFILFSARTRAASTQVGSLRVVRACRGVLVVDCFTRHACRFEASNMFAGLTVRRQKVYRLRRYRSLPVEAG